MEIEQSPETPLESTPESIRLASLRLESGIKSIGQLCYLVAFFSILGMLEFTLFAIGVIPRGDLESLGPASVLDLLFWALTGIFTINTLAQMVLGYGLIRLHSWARWTVIALTLLSLSSSTMSSLVFCLSDSPTKILQSLIGSEVPGRIVGLVSLVGGGAIHLLILWPLVAPGSNLVFSPAYRAVIRQTPSIRSRMHWLLKLLIVCILLGFFGTIAYLAAIYFRIID